MRRLFLPLPSLLLFLAAGLAGILPTPASAAITNGMPASYVLGQSDFTSSTAATTQSGVNAPEAGFVYDATHHRLFVDDSLNNRVLVFDLSGGITNGMNASYVLGQPDFTSSTAATTQSGMNYPDGLAYDSAHERLFVAEENNNRILVFDLSNGITNGMPASNVLGQPDFTSSTAATTQSGMHNPYGLVYDSTHQRLFVDDSYQSNRVLVYDLSSGISNGMNASYVLGQPDFTHNTAATTQAGLSYPQGLAYDAMHQQLFVADGNNSRDLVFDLSNGITNGMPASNVLGQPDFTSSSYATTQSEMNGSDGLSYDSISRRLFVTDLFNYRVLVFDLSNGITNGMNASYVLGQPDFTSSTAATTQSGMNFPEGIGYDCTADRLFVSDNGSNRVLVFSFGGGNLCPTSTSPSSSGSSSPSSPLDDPSDLHAADIHFQQGKVNPTTGHRLISVAPDHPITLTSFPAEVDQLTDLTLRLNGTVYHLHQSTPGAPFRFTLSGLPAGSYPYSLTAHYHSTTRTEYGVITVGEGKPVKPITLDNPIIKAINSTFQAVYHHLPNFTQWQYWADRILRGEKRTIEALAGAMGWQFAHGK